MPFAGYKDFAACVAANSDKDDPDAYCGSIKHEVEDKVDAPDVVPDRGDRAETKLDGPAEVPDRRLTLAVAGASLASTSAVLALYDTEPEDRIEEQAPAAAPPPVPHSPSVSLAVAEATLALADAELLLEDSDIG